MTLQKIIKGVFEELEEVMLQMDSEAYSAASINLFNATIGEHARHILEMFQCLLNGYESGIINYDKRLRDRRIEKDIEFAIQVMQEILDNINRPGKVIFLETSFGCNDRVVTIESNYERELLYNLEHTIHHMALIKVGIAELTDITVSGKFGVAPSTIQYRAECVQ